jgi:hypothetical protein
VQNDRERQLEKERESGGVSSTTFASSGAPGGRQHTLLLIDCGPSMMMKTTKTTTTTLVEEKLSSSSHPSSSSLAPSCGLLRALRGCEKYVLEHVRGVATGRHGRRRTSRDAVGVVLYNTRVRLPVQWNNHNIEGSASQQDKKKKQGKPKRDEDNDDDDEDEEDDDEEEEENDDFLAFRTAPSRTHEFVPLEPPGASTIQRIRAAIQGKIDLAALYGHGDIDAAATFASSSNTSTSVAHSYLDEAVLAATSTVKAHVRKNVMSDSVQTLVFTNNPNPCRPESMLGLRDMVQDLRRLGRGEVTVVPVDDDPLERYGSGSSDDGGGGGGGNNNIGLHMDVMVPTENDEDLEDDLCDRLVRSVARARPKWRRIPLIRPDWRDFSGEKGANGSPSGILLDWYDLVGSTTAPSEKEVDAFTGLYV